MGMTLGQQADRLMEELRTIDRDEALRRINVAYLRNSEAHAWRHLLKRFTLQTEAQYNTGTVAVVETGTSVTLTDGAWTVSWGTAPSMRRIVIAGRAEPYDVTVFGSTTTATIADPWIGDDETEARYRLFRDTYPLPTDCDFTRVLALYDPDQRCRLMFYNQPRFINTRASDPTLVSTPECFTIVAQTSETPPRPQVQLYPAPDSVRTYHGWYFRRPAFLSAEGDYLDWPSSFDDMIWQHAAIAYYSQPLRYSPKLRDAYKLTYSDLFNRMKTEMDGQNAMETDIADVGAGRRSSMFDFSGVTVATGLVDWS
jgi:hypothetical protein